MPFEQQHKKATKRKFVSLSAQLRSLSQRNVTLSPMPPLSSLLFISPYLNGRFIFLKRGNCPGPFVNPHAFGIGWETGFGTSSEPAYTIVVDNVRFSPPYSGDSAQFGDCFFRCERRSV